MDNEVRSLFLLVFFIGTFFTAKFAVNAQTADFFVENRIVQRLTWEGDEYASRYEVIIEKFENNRYTRVVHEYRTNFYIDVSLQHGIYRYRIIPYDLLDRPVRGTDWIELEVLRAVIPELNRVIQRYEIIDNQTMLMMNVYGRNIDQEAIFFLQIDNRIIIQPTQKQINENGSGATLFFDVSSFSENLNLNIRITVRNPGGFEANFNSSIVIQPADSSDTELAAAVDDTVVADTISIVDEAATDDAVPDDTAVVAFDDTETVDDTTADGDTTVDHPAIADAPDEDEKTKKRIIVRKLDFYFSVAFMPIFPAYGGMNIFSEEVLLMDLTARFGILFRNLKNIGMETYISQTSFGTFDDNFFTAGINLFAQKWINDEKLALRIRLGAGYVFLSEFDEQLLNITTGCSIAWFPKKHFFMEAGIESTNWIQDSENLGGFGLWIGAGVRF